MLEAADNSLLWPLAFLIVILCKRESIADSSVLPFKRFFLAGLCLLWVLLESPFGLDIISMSDDVVVSSSSPKKSLFYFYAQY